MKSNLLKTCMGVACLLTAAHTMQAQSGPARYVVLVTIDGFRPEFYLDSSYGMFTVRDMMRRGVAAKGADPVFPSVTYPDHTTLITGVTPAKHGIYYNTPFEPEGQTGKWMWDYNLIKTETLWSAMHKAGKKTACVRWPVTYNAPIDYRIPEYWDYKNFSDARPFTAAATQPLSLWQEVQDHATGHLDADDIGTDHNELVSDENMARITGYLLRQYKPNFTAVHLACTDHYEHQEGREAYMVRASVAGADRCVKTIIESLNRAGIADSTLLIVTGDHGFENIYRSFNPNYLLKQAGLIKDAKAGDWKAQFHSSGGGAFLQLKDPNDKATVAKVAQLLGQLPDSAKRYFAIVSKEKLEQVGADPGVPLALTGLNGTSFGAGTDRLVETFDKVRGTHGYFPDHQQIKTGFVACGPGLKPSTVVPNMRLLDVTPLIVKLTGIAFPQTDGKLIDAFLK
ncbi:alkaline phosphatase family protein [Taibaiella koreensis]|uniref:alkaline phosphatase family protein n=1 Tax=Taibaiella koreensis TaxID=1268548 RepID=UPI000E5A030D|nr:ectonucleotide pyrophosphatase/phosphodiesterase [Taibaiella koreensis]